MGGIKWTSWSRRGLAVASLLGGLACGEQPVAVIESDLPGSCRLPADLLTATSQAPAMAPAELRPALSYAALISASLGPAPELSTLQRSLATLGETFGASPEADCRELTVAWTSLRAIASSPETMPDRDGIVLVLELAARSLAALQR